MSLLAISRTSTAAPPIRAAPCRAFRAYSRSHRR